jgi:hypothetical protein
MKSNKKLDKIGNYTYLIKTNVATENEILDIYLKVVFVKIRRF